MASSRIDPESLRKAKEVVCANLPPRYFVLDQLERYVIGTQYEHLRRWGDEAFPLFERAPCIQYPIVQRSIDSNADLCLGEGRWPTITSNPGEDDTVFDERFGLDEEQSAVIDRGIKAIVEQADLVSVANELLCEGQGSKTAVAVCCIRDGRLCVESVKAKHCAPKFLADRPNEVESLEVKYPYIDSWFNQVTKKWEARVLIYRRVIDATSDKTFKPVLANENGEDINDATWKVSAEVAHGFGFCPVVWYPFMRKTCDAGDIDGVAAHQQITDEVDGLNYALSMRHRAALCAGDPQIIETGVDDDEMNAPMGRPAQAVAQPGDLASMNEWRDVRGQSAMNMPTRKRGVGTIWSTPNPQAKVAFLTLPSDALKVLEDDANDLLNMLREALAYVSVDPSNAKLGIGDLSGKALEWFHKKQTDRCTKIRSDFGQRCLLPLINMLLRIVFVKSRVKDAALFLNGVDAIGGVLAKFEQQYGNSGTRWFPPYLRLIWGPFFAATAADAKLDVDTSIEARDAGFITTETAVRKIAPHFPSIGDVNQYLESLENEKRSKMSAMHDAQAALMNAGKAAEESDADEKDDGAEFDGDTKAEAQADKKPREAPQRKPPTTKKPLPIPKKRVKKAA